MDNENKKTSSKRMNELVHNGNKILKVLYILFIILLIYVITLVVREWSILSIIGKILSIVSPLFIGWFVAWLLNPIVKKLTSKGVKRGLATAAAYLIMIAILAIILGLTIPTLGDQVTALVSSLPKIANDVTAWIDKIFRTLSHSNSGEILNFENIELTLMSNIQDKFGTLQTQLPGYAVGAVSGLATGIGKILLSLLLGFYILYDYEEFKDGFIGLFPKKAKAEITYLLGQLNDTLYAFMSGTLWLSLLLFVVSIIGFSLIGLNAPILIAFICAITNLIPYIGPYIGAAIAGAIGFAESTTIGILTLVFILVVQTIDGEILNPLVMSKKMNLSPITIILSLLIFEYLFGIFGMIIATPVVALLKIIYNFFDEKYDFFGFLEDEKKD